MVVDGSVGSPRTKAPASPRGMSTTSPYRERGATSGAGLTIMVRPAASAGASFIMIRPTG